MGLELLKSPTLRELSLFDLSGGSLEDYMCKAVFMSFNWELLPVQTPGSVCQKQSEAIDNNVFPVF